MKVWAVIRNYEYDDGYALPSAVFSSKEVAEKYVLQEGGDYDLFEYEVADKCPPPTIRVTYADSIFGLAMPEPEPGILPGLISAYPRYYLTDLLDKMPQHALVDFSWEQYFPLTRWERFKDRVTTFIQKIR